MSAPFVESDHPRARGRFTDKGQSAPQVELTVGPSTVIPGAVGYSVTESRMSRAFIPVEDRPAVAAELASGYNPGTAGARVEYWMTKFDAYDIFEAAAPEGSSDAARQGFESVSIEKMNLDLDHQALSYNAWTVRKNQDLAENRGGVYRNSTNPERQKALDEFWDARAARLGDVHDQLIALSLR